jgi:hypothetical protein
MAGIAAVVSAVAATSLHVAALVRLLGRSCLDMGCRKAATAIVVFIAVQALGQCVARGGQGGMGRGRTALAAVIAGLEPGCSKL